MFLAVLWPENTPDKTYCNYQESDDAKDDREVATSGIGTSDLMLLMMDRSHSGVDGRAGSALDLAMCVLHNEDIIKRGWVTILTE